MRIVDVEQGTFEWLEARLGIPTASRFDAIVTPKTMQPSSAQRDYVVELIAERILGCPLDDVTSIWQHRGIQLEDEARAWYEMRRAVDVQQVGFCKHETLEVGGSPDGLVGDDGLVEIKCRSAKNHLRSVLEYQDIATSTQVQGLMWVTGREWCDVVAYCPNPHPKDSTHVMPNRITRVKRDTGWMEALDDAMDLFLTRLDVEWERVKRMGRAVVDSDNLEAELQASVDAMYGGEAA